MNRYFQNQAIYVGVGPDHPFEALNITTGRYEVADPTDFTLTVEDPAGVETVHARATFQHPATGVYLKAIALATVGVHTLRIDASGAVTAVAEWQVEILRSKIASD